MNTHMNNRKFAQMQFERRQEALQGIVNGRADGANMNTGDFDKMSSLNIRGLDQVSAQMELRRLEVINKGLGFRLPEQQRIEKLIHAKGRKLDKPLTPFDKSIKNLGDKLTDKSVKLPFGDRAYQFIVDIAHEQVLNKISNNEILVIDIQSNQHMTTIMPTLELQLEMNRDQVNAIINRILVNNRMILLYLDPHNSRAKAELIKLNQIAGKVNNMADLKEKILGVKPITKEDVSDILKQILNIGDDIADVMEDAREEINELSSDSDEQDEAIEEIEEMSNALVVRESNNIDNDLLKNVYVDIMDDYVRRFVTGELDVSNDDFISAEVRKLNKELEEQDVRKLNEHLANSKKQLAIVVPKAVEDFFSGKGRKQIKKSTIVDHLKRLETVNINNYTKNDIGVILRHSAEKTQDISDFIMSLFSDSADALTIPQRRKAGELILKTYLGSDELNNAINKFVKFKDRSMVRTALVNNIDSFKNKVDDLKIFKAIKKIIIQLGALKLTKDFDKDYLE